MRATDNESLEAPTRDVASPRALAVDEPAQDRARLEHAQRLERVTDALPALVSYVDADERYQFANRSYERWFGHKARNIQGKHLREVLGDEAYATVRPHIRQALAGHATYFRMHVPYAHGSARFVEATYTPDLARDGSVSGIVVLVADATDRRRLDAARDATLVRNQRLVRITAAIADAVSPEQVFDALVDQVATALGASSAGLWLLAQDGRSVELARSLGYSDVAARSLQTMSLDDPHSLPVLDAMRTGNPVLIQSQAELIAAYPNLSAIVTHGRSYRLSCLPIHAQGRTLGALGLTFDDARPPDAAEPDFLMLVARYSGQALERLRLLEVERRTRARAEAAASRLGVLSRASRAFSEAGSDLSALLTTVVEEITRDHADACVMMLRPEGGSALELAALHHRDAAELNELRALFALSPPSVTGSLSGEVASTGKPVLLVVEDAATIRAAAHPRQRAWAERRLPASVALVPLRVRGRTLGTLAAIRERSAVSFSDEDQQVLQELGERAGVAIESSQLYRDNQLARARAELLYGMANAVIRASCLDDVFAAAHDAIEQGLEASRSAILTCDADDVMRFKSCRGLSLTYRHAVEGHSPWPRGARDPSPVLISDVASDPSLKDLLPSLRSEDIQAMGFIPLVAGDRLVGKFMLYYAQPRQLSEPEIALAKAIADQVAAAVARFAALSELQQTVRFNEMFTGMLGHDLRNPLGAIMTAAQLAMKRGEGERLLRPLSRILTSGARMARMIDQLLDFTRLRVGSGIPVERKRIDLAQLLQQVIDELEHAHPACALRLTQRGNDASGEWDADRLSQVFSNLIANAVQHGVEPAGVSIAIDATDPAVLRIEIHNMGTITPAVLPKLFEPMTGGDSRGDKSHGLGLGLYISREIVRAHAGRIDVRSSETQGTTITVSLPRSVTPHRTTLASP